jgi:uncharacterized surface anchored protein
VDEFGETEDWFHPRRPAAAAGPAGGPLMPRGAPGGSAAGPPVQVTGRVRTTDGVPIAEAAVTLADLSGRQVTVAKADAGGQYRLTAPVAGSYLVIASAAGHQPAAGVVTVAGAAAGHDVVLQGGSGLAGIVRVAGTGQPVSGAMVTVADVEGEIAGVTTADSSGAFHLTHLAPGNYALVVAATTYTPVAVPVSVSEGEVTQRDVELPASGRVAGTVLNASGDAPFPGARIALVDGTGAEAAATAADANGEFMFNDVPSGSYMLVASGYRPGVLALSPGDERGRQADIVLADPLR